MLLKSKVHEFGGTNPSKTGLCRAGADSCMGHYSYVFVSVCPTRLKKKGPPLRKNPSTSTSIGAYW